VLIVETVTQASTFVVEELSSALDSGASLKIGTSDALSNVGSESSEIK